jgi:hypothetical protein
MRSRKMTWVRHVASMWEKGNAYKMPTGKPEGKKPMGIPACELKDNIKMDLR